jgi:glyoxylate reductase
VSKLPASLKYICHNGAGYDNIDVAACTARGIQVSHTPKAVNAATADIAIFLLLGALRRIHVPYAAIRNKQWRGGAQLGYDPENKKLGILGMGGIGREVAKRARAFGMEILYHNRSRLSPELEQGAKYVSFEELMQSSDVISLNCSLRKETVGIIGTKEFDMMKEGVIIVNTARGKLIDEAALVAALESGKVFSAGLDVYEEEPTVHEGLLNNPNVVLLPHIGTATKETQVSILLDREPW